MTKITIVSVKKDSDGNITGLIDIQGDIYPKQDVRISIEEHGYIFEVWDKFYGIHDAKPLVGIVYDLSVIDGFYLRSYKDGSYTDNLDNLHTS